METNVQNQTALTEKGTAGEIQKEERRREYIPAADLYESAEAFLLVTELPGVREEDLAITVEKNILTITGRTSLPETGEEYRLTYSECRPGNFKRSFSLSDEIDRDRIHASYKDGVLKLEMKRIKPSVKRIEIQKS